MQPLYMVCGDHIELAIDMFVDEWESAPDIVDLQAGSNDEAHGSREAGGDRTTLSANFRPESGERGEASGSALTGGFLAESGDPHVVDRRHATPDCAPGTSRDAKTADVACCFLCERPARYQVVRGETVDE